ncbi:hypothetical protein HZS91_00552 [Xanthomonas citri pv. citri]|nr:hypothetical protein HZS91_00552 [Xanthomonas citri pv. citri]
MEKSRFTDSQIISVLKQAEAGTPVPELRHEHGISSGAFYKRRSKFGGMDASLMAQLKELEEESRRLKEDVRRSPAQCRPAQEDDGKNITTAQSGTLSWHAPCSKTSRCRTSYALPMVLQPRAPQRGALRHHANAEIGMDCLAPLPAYAKSEWITLGYGELI